MLTRVPRIAASEITPPEIYLNRRTLLAGALSSAASAWLPAAEGAPPAAAALAYTRNPQYSVSEPPNTLEQIAGYNNFYEFGTDKESPGRFAHTLRTRPWSVTVQGEAEVRGRFNLEDLLRGQALEERIYRFRCVEAWSLVVPWGGFPLSDLLARFQPTSGAKYVEFTTLYDPAQMPGQRSAVLNWPYVEGLRIDEAMHPLTLMVVGLYGRVLPNQDGAPLRVIVPWKYGFQNLKTNLQNGVTARRPHPPSHVAAPPGYGFFAHVNPHARHPRWI